MRGLIIFISVLGFITMVNAQQHDRSRVHGPGEKQHFGQGPSVRTSAPPMVRTAPPAMQTAPRINTVPQTMHRAPVTVTQPATVTQTAPRLNTRQETMSSGRHQSFQSSNWHGDHGYSHHGHHGHHGNYHNNYYGGTSVFVPYWWYGTYPYNYYDDDYYSSSQAPYYSSSQVAYPNRIFICYEEDQVYDDRYHIDCPVPISWYSTDPAYDSEDYASQYRPEYVCPDNGASQYVEFTNSYEANTWWNNNCDRWIYTP